MRKRLLTRLAAAGAGGALALAAASPAFATDSIEVELQEPHQESFASDADEQKCADADKRMAPREDDEDGFHLILAAGNILELTVTFAPDGDPDSDPSTHEEISGVPGDSASEIDFYQVGPGDDPQWQHAYVFVPAGWMLLNAIAEVDEDDAENNLVISHACAGDKPGDEPSDGPSDEPSEPGDEPSEPGDEPSEPGDDEEEDEELPVTGAQVGGLLVLAGGLLAGGVAMLFVRRRRNLADMLES